MSLQPFVKWAGGKRQIVDKLKQHMPKKYKKYYEPFVGGGALLLAIEPKHAVINDSNKELIYVYKCLRDKRLYDKMIALCHEHEKNHCEAYFYEIRDLDRYPRKYSKMPVYFKAARCLYLNKACFNGLYRVNGKGYFNVPSAQRETVKCFDEENMKNLYDYFHKRKPVILCKDFALAVKSAKAGDLVYFDPPYDAVGKQSFTTYTKNDFGKEQQIRLRDTIQQLSDKGVLVMASNANTPFIQDLYKSFNIHVIEARRSINSKGDGRGKVEEVIITNY